MNHSFSSKQIVSLSSILVYISLPFLAPTSIAMTLRNSEKEKERENNHYKSIGNSEEGLTWNRGEGERVTWKGVEGRVRSEGREVFNFRDND